MKSKAKYLLPVATMIVPILLAACGGEPAGVAQTSSVATPGTLSYKQAQIDPYIAMAEPTATTGSGAESPLVNKSVQSFDSSNLGVAPGGANAYGQGDEGTTSTPIQEALPPNPFVSTTEDHLSTFAMDVDTGSYSAARTYLTTGTLPPASIVRTEEFVNYFHYNYPSPQNGAFGIHVDSAPSPYGQSGNQIVRVGIQGKTIDTTARKNAVLTFVIDVSGSMQQPNRLPLVKEALQLLVGQLNQEDKVGIVVYGSEARVLLDHTTAASKDKIMAAIDSLADEGSTNAEAGLRLGYELAGKNFANGAINRVILCSDGVANVGEAGPDGIRKAIRDYTAQGIELTTVGFGMGDYNDYLMEQLADDGDGNYAYVDNIGEAQRIFVQNLTGMLQVIAKDAKIQVDFNPEVVARYRLIGYENRDVADQDFRNDKVDAGEVGSGHSVTALYEVETLKGTSSAAALTVQVRYVDPTDGQVHEINQPFNLSDFGTSVDSAAPDFQLALAVAGFAEQLRSTSNQFVYKGEVLALAQKAATALPQDADAQEFARLVSEAADIR